MTNCTQNITNREYKYNYCTICSCKCVHIIAKNNTNGCNHICSNSVVIEKKYDGTKNHHIDMKKNNMSCALNILNKNNNITTKNIHGELDNIDDKTNQLFDSLQGQINLINKSYLEIFDEMTEENNSTKILATEINKINDTLDTLLLNKLICDNKCDNECDNECEDSVINQQIIIASQKRKHQKPIKNKQRFLLPNYFQFFR